MSRMLSADVHRLVADSVPLSERDRSAQADFLTYFADETGPVRRESGPDHATASCVVFDKGLTQTLLVFHGKGRFWAQPGG